MHREPAISTPLAHGRVLHGLPRSGKGLVSVAQKVRGEWKENVFSVEHLLEILPAYSGATDVYISQNRFWRWRGVSRLAELTALYTDLDYYRYPDLAEMHVNGVLHIAMEELEKARIPHPSFATSTGRGLALVWLHRPVSQKDLPKWNLCQRRILQALRNVGADSAATDAARVLRLVGTLNSRSGSLVQTLWEDLDYIWEFDELIDEILPPTVRKPERNLNRRPPSSSNGKVRQTANTGQRLSAKTLNKTRLEDLHKLMDLRGQEQLPPGKRDSWMLVAATCLSRLVAPEYLEREVYRLAGEVAGWRKSETKSRMQQVFVRASAAAKDDKVLWRGSFKDPRYEFTNQRIIDLLDITPEEERELKTIISKDTKRQRDRERKESRRRSQGAKPRDEYITQARDKRQKVKELHEQGYSNSEIALQTGYSARHISRVLRDLRRSLE